MTRRFLRQFKAHPRLLTGIAIAALSGFVLPQSWPHSTRTIVALDAGSGIFLILTWIMIAQSTVDHMRARAAMQDEGRGVVLLLTIGALVFSMVSIALELHGAKDMPPERALSHVGLAAASIICSWMVTHTMFALHYAHGFYTDPDPNDEDSEDHVGGLDIPGCKHPDYWDFLYFSFTIGMTFQTSDTQITARTLRRETLAHSVVSFFFNTVILALSINIAAGLL